MPAQKNRPLQKEAGFRGKPCQIAI